MFRDSFNFSLAVVIRHSHVLNHPIHGPDHLSVGGDELPVLDRCTILPNHPLSDCVHTEPPPGQVAVFVDHFCMFRFFLGTV